MCVCVCVKSLTDFACDTKEERLPRPVTDLRFYLHATSDLSSRLHSCVSLLSF